MKPIISTIPAFDAENSAQQVYFYWQGNPCIGAKITVTNPLSDELIWESQKLSVTQRYNRYMCVIPAGAIEDNIQRDSDYRNYVCVVQAYYYDTDIENQTYEAISPMSDPQPLYAYADPTFQWDNSYIMHGKIVHNSSLVTGITYSQPAGEQLSYFTIHLYNSNQVEIGNSGKLYNATDTYKFTGLVGNEEYWLLADGKTEFDRELATEKIKFKCKYDAPQSQISVTAESLRCEGINKVSVFMNANLYAFDHGTEYDDGRFTEGTWINLTDPDDNGVPGNGLTYMNSTGINADNSIGLVLKDPIPNSMVAKITDDAGNDICELWYHEIEQTFWDSMVDVHTIGKPNSYNPFYHTFTDSEKDIWDSVKQNPVKDIASVDPPFASQEYRDEYWATILSDEQQAPDYPPIRSEYPQPCYEHTTRIIAWFSLHYGVNDVYAPFTVIYDDNIDVDNIDEYSTLQSYAVGDYCKHNGEIYCCTNAVESGSAFNLENWEGVIGTRLMGVDITDPESDPTTRIEPTVWKIVMRSNGNYYDFDVERQVND